jgi:hypothetical protein
MDHPISGGTLDRWLSFFVAILESALFGVPGTQGCFGNGYVAIFVGML